MRPRLCALVTLLVLSACGGQKPTLGPSLDEFALLERDVTALKPLPPASEALAAGQARRDEARALDEKGKHREARRSIDEGIADARVALAAAAAEDAANREDECLRLLDRARQDWEEAELMLGQTERVATRSAPDSLHQSPETPAPAPAPLPPSTLDGTKPAAGSPAELEATFQLWCAAAREYRVGSAEMESRFNARMARLTARKPDPEEAPVDLFVAGRIIQELEARVREAGAIRACLDAAALTARFGDARERILRATLEIERGMREDLRGELEKTRTEARERQSDLYGALQKLEGRFATITQNARGTIVSLADILFDTGKATLKRDVEFGLVKIATILAQFPEMKIQIEGHTDNVGSEEYNLDLSRKRAETVREFLAAQGVEEARMTTAGYGFTRPVADNATEDGRKKNRRVDLVINDRP